MVWLIFSIFHPYLGWLAPSFNMLWAVTVHVGQSLGGALGDAENMSCWQQIGKHESIRPAMGIESAKMADIEMVDPLGCYFRFIQALLHWSKQMQTEYVHPCCQAVRLAFVTWRRRLPGPPHQRCCPDLIWIWRGINGEHWFRFQELSFELSRSHGHYSYKYFEDLD